MSTTAWQCGPGTTDNQPRSRPKYRVDTDFVPQQTRAACALATSWRIHTLVNYSWPSRVFKPWRWRNARSE
ncbi:hypothetical protein ColLi_12924 [Colletotrichum liriopes]|uniref:Uncharacterized protein n=1 Tax=Colletotrichum liriopes TaxID=708192 RepID=A0AA37M003_9PEZI|nr:hypothetical protein ColLi_12924 [Colletotrichum liriopes]